ncbi:MAG: trehalose-phosphatase [Gemmatimonadaceae bacterium]
MKARTDTRRRRVTRRRELPPPQTDWAYFFDIDGTLVDIAPTPAEIYLAHDLHLLIRRLHDATGGALALISGRSIANVDSIFGGSQLPVAGQHGLERRNAKGEISRHSAISKKLERARHKLGEAVARHRGLLLEDKGLSLALHYRAAPSLASFAHRTIRSLAAAIGPDYTVQSGKRVIELKPSGRDKGQAVREFMHEQPFARRTPVFVGDDVTDEHGFKVVNALGGYAVKVGAGATAAHFRLKDVSAVKRWLEQIGQVPAASRALTSSPTS